MNKSDFYYDLPEELIAQHPVEPRDSSRLMTVDRQTGKIEHKHFYDILDELNEGDCLILNNTRVLPARLYGIKKDTGAKVEFLLLTNKGDDTWECIVGPGKRAKPGTQFSFADGLLECEVKEVLDGGNRLVKFFYDGNFYNVLDKIGQMPLPPYITHKLQDKNRYQTVYAKHDGSAAAPTAGLHFTPELLAAVKAKGVEIAEVTLHVGLGTFRPVKVDDVKNHVMHKEEYFMSKEVADKLNKAKQDNKRIIAVGTTSTRVLETIMSKYNEFRECHEESDIFIYPGYKFKAVDALITNFHLPKSTLIMLVSALAGKENIMEAYAHAVKEKYRFFSFGDAMFIK